MGNLIAPAHVKRASVREDMKSYQKRKQTVDKEKKREKESYKTRKAKKKARKDAEGGIIQVTRTHGSADIPRDICPTISSKQKCNEMPGKMCAWEEESCTAAPADNVEEFYHWRKAIRRAEAGRGGARWISERRRFNTALRAGK